MPFTPGAHCLKYTSRLFFITQVKGTGEFQLHPGYICCMGACDIATRKGIVEGHGVILEGLPETLQQGIAPLRWNTNINWTPILINSE